MLNLVTTDIAEKAEFCDKKNVAKWTYATSEVMSKHQSITWLQNHGFTYISNQSKQLCALAWNISSLCILQRCSRTVECQLH